MEPLPMAPSTCSLDRASLDEQLGRYRAVGQDAVCLSRTETRLALTVNERVPNRAVDELIAVENRCCPFFALDWEPAHRRLAISVHAPEHAGALEAIVLALGSGATPAAREPLENPLHRRLVGE
jgi:hypothetical protein